MSKQESVPTVHPAQADSEDMKEVTSKNVSGESTKEPTSLHADTCTFSSVMCQGPHSYTESLTPHPGHPA